MKLFIIVVLSCCTAVVNTCVIENSERSLLLTKKSKDMLQAAAKKGYKVQLMCLFTPDREDEGEQVGGSAGRQLFKPDSMDLETEDDDSYDEEELVDDKPITGVKIGIDISDNTPAITDPGYEKRLTIVINIFHSLKKLKSINMITEEILLDPTTSLSEIAELLSKLDLNKQEWFEKLYKNALLAVGNEIKYDIERSIDVPAGKKALVIASVLGIELKNNDTGLRIKAGDEIKDLLEEIGNLVFNNFSISLASNELKDEKLFQVYSDKLEQQLHTKFGSYFDKYRNDSLVNVLSPFKMIEETVVYAKDKELPEANRIDESAMRTSVYIQSLIGGEGFYDLVSDIMLHEREYVIDANGVELFDPNKIKALEDKTLRTLGSVLRGTTADGYYERIRGGFVSNLQEAIISAGTWIVQGGVAVVVGKFIVTPIVAGLGRIIVRYAVKPVVIWGGEGARNMVKYAERLIKLVDRNRQLCGASAMMLDLLPGKTLFECLPRDKLLELRNKGIRQRIKNETGRAMLNLDVIKARAFVNIQNTMAQPRVIRFIENMPEIFGRAEEVYATLDVAFPRHQSIPEVRGVYKYYKDVGRYFEKLENEIVEGFSVLPEDFQSYVVPQSAQRLQFVLSNAETLSAGLLKQEDFRGMMAGLFNRTDGTVPFFSGNIHSSYFATARISGKLSQPSAKTILGTKIINFEIHIPPDNTPIASIRRGIARTFESMKGQNTKLSSRYVVCNLSLLSERHVFEELESTYLGGIGILEFLYGDSRNGKWYVDFGFVKRGASGQLHLISKYKTTLVNRKIVKEPIDILSAAKDKLFEQ